VWLELPLKVIKEIEKKEVITEELTEMKKEKKSWYQGQRE
jgi:hypothetical protein